MESHRNGELGSFRRRVRVALVGVTLTLVISGCTSAKKTASPPSATTPASTATATATDSAAAAKAMNLAAEAASGFVSGVRSGDGAAACALLTDAEQAAFVANAGQAKQKLDTKSCESVVTSFSAANKARIKSLDGTLTDVSVAGTFADGTWKWIDGNGEQAAVLEQKGDQWRFGTDSNDFPTSVLHFFD